MWFFLIFEAGREENDVLILLGASYRRNDECPTDPTLSCWTQKYDNLDLEARILKGSISGSVTARLQPSKDNLLMMLCVIDVIADTAHIHKKMMC